MTGSALVLHRELSEELSSIGRRIAVIGEPHRVGFTVKKSATQEQLIDAVRALGELRKVVVDDLARNVIPWQIGAILNTMQNRHGETYAQAMNETGYSYNRLATIKSTEAAIPEDERYYELSFDHHVMMAGYKPEERRILLELAAHYNLSRGVLRMLADIDPDDRVVIVQEVEERQLDGKAFARSIRDYCNTLDMERTKYLATAGEKRAKDTVMSIAPGIAPDDFDSLVSAIKGKTAHDAAVEALRWYITKASDHAIKLLEFERSGKRA